ncbi:ATP-dependent nuclease [Rhodococcoides kroppenstedtii]|uniref:ATP-dependent nuclease n=1 Tax=Rhodococcoides kroppenstedtii TaxID=293050 RepID=UPI001BDEEB38|nr:AAA family ATPase [Rhodococcus kroppenstedtii]MBT1192042.1 AAA family ATPase [Rhodococcus kroppenstedtii]
MRLTQIKISNFRSFVGDHQFDLAGGINFIVGPNNCGKSNLLAAIELAMDPEAEFIPDRDRPASSHGVGGWAKSRIVMVFQKTNGTSPEKTLLARAMEYETALRAKQGKTTNQQGRTHAENGDVHRVVAFGAAGARQVSYMAKGLGAVSMPIDSEEHVKLEAQFLRVLRFGVVHSGQDLRSVLSGRFREILQLVINDHLSAEMAETDSLRQTYLEGLESKLLKPLREQVQINVGGMFPEVNLVKFLPSVPTLGQTLSEVGVELGDGATTELTGKGTGVRGAVLVSMLQYLADQSRRSLVLAVEEPEAFLHPGAQELLGAQLQQLAKRSEVTLMVTTHSQYIVSRDGGDRIFELNKNSDGYTRLARCANGDDDRAELLGSLYSDAGLARVLDRATKIPDKTRAVVITEGYTDDKFLRFALQTSGNAHLLDGLHFLPANGSKNVVFQAVLTQSATNIPVIALLDFDEMGKKAAGRLEDFGWKKSSEILLLSAWPARCKRNHDVEVEDLLPKLAAMAAGGDLGDDAYDQTIKCDNGERHYKFSKEWKESALQRLPQTLKGADCSGMIWLAEEINRRITKLVGVRNN